ncbi:MULTISPECIES: fumarylacetoacetate hydrolase family protein [Vibrio]|uniref:fumarylacetoacetate hydrolase family protein n=1 Tax=Vibrio TaxID=662 RepID=UPI000200DD2F|nr:fumarylacetoacetate hydrolase family protein [Vibrio furnissii]ADT89286.1 2-keto-4-pentenoate hydratase [Vibrio furnissii NCTC 11218]MCG6227721.1 fumarylacetoacetate hydrolase family protein [Vibrio furnissii]MCG6234336.1 fumarylacetoacetate hydrolase family protein [Vibrio furnissii]MCG6260388.1 fumarylacetoacetate hydrolase family protein [Vibrio furnissii]MCG6269423.1 fumarylacetoacetate hydrolase family protein [Vibrio furnissii]
MKTVRFEEQQVTPSKVLCVGRNYVEHVKELNNAMPDQMVVFNKPNSSISSTLRAFHDEPLHYETEICFVVENGQYVGVGLGLDLTKRELQSQLKQKQLPWERAKAFDGSAVFSRFVSLDGLDVEQLSLELFINCVRVQCGGVAQMMFKPAMILQELQSYTTLIDGDIVMTGTPQGVGVVHAGDVFLGRLKCGDHVLLEIEWLAE